MFIVGFPARLLARPRLGADDEAQRQFEANNPYSARV